MKSSISLNNFSESIFRNHEMAKIIHHTSIIIIPVQYHCSIDDFAVICHVNSALLILQL